MTTKNDNESVVPRVDLLSRSRGLRLRQSRDAILHYRNTTPLRSGQVANLLGLARGGVWGRAVARKLLALPDSPRRLLYPAWQFDEAARELLVPGLRYILATMPVNDPWGLAGILTHPQPSLDGRAPIDELIAGGVRLKRATEIVQAIIADSYETGRP